MRPDVAFKFAAELDEWWHKKGYPTVRHTVEPINVRGRGNICIVRSNLVRGLPPRAPVLEMVE